MCPCTLVRRELVWGGSDYDRFHQWQAHGRQIQKEMVEKKEWATKDSPLVFVSEENPDNIISVPPEASKGDDMKLEEKDPIPLWDKLNPSAETLARLRGGSHARGWLGRGRGHNNRGGSAQ